MDEKRLSSYISPERVPKKDKPPAKLAVKKVRGDPASRSLSNTTFYKEKRFEKNKYERITQDQYMGKPESMSGSSDSYHCVHGPEGKKYSPAGLLKRNLLKNLDPLPVDPIWTEKCVPDATTKSYDLAKKLVFLVTDPVCIQLTDRMEDQLKEYVRLSGDGFYICELEDLCIVLKFLIDYVDKQPSLLPYFRSLVNNLRKPVLLKMTSDIVTHFDKLRSYFMFLGYFLISLEDDAMFKTAAEALVWQLSAPDRARGTGSVRLRHALDAAAGCLNQTVARMLALARQSRFRKFMEIALLLAYESLDNCIEMMKENIIENIFYRFNPYFPDRKLPEHEINPADPQDYRVKLGDSSVHMWLTLTLLLVLVKTTKQFLDYNPKYRRLLPCPDDYAQRCFIWAYRYECRAEHRHQRTTLTVIVTVLLDCFGDRLETFSCLLMPDVISMAVLTEVPSRLNWINSVPFNTGQMDVHFKKLLIYLSIDFLKAFPRNNIMIENRHWLMGLMYLLDPGLSQLRARWSPALFEEIRKTAFQALILTMHLTPPKLVKEYGLIRRLLWYVEWYSERPFDLSTLYWCMRLLQVSILPRTSHERKVSIRSLFDTHGVIILLKLCHTLLDQKLPPIEKSQAILSLSLRMLTSAAEANLQLTCCIYPEIKWPSSVNSLVRRMLDVVLQSLEKHFIICDRWLISLLNFLWQTVIWTPEYRHLLLLNNGMYKLLDIITMIRPPVQCIALAVVCDVARAGDAVGQLVTWRASLGASNANSVLVRRGSTIASLLAAVFREECLATGVHLDDRGVILDLEHPLMSSEARSEIDAENFHEGKSLRSPICLAAAELAGSRMSKAYALLHLLSEDLEYKVSLVDEAYNLYKNIKLTAEDEVSLVLCSHYLTVKLNEAWTETQMQCVKLLQPDEETLDEFLQMGRGWAKEIQRQQEEVLERLKKQEIEEESSLYSFLGRVRLNVALDALRETRTAARASDRRLAVHAMLHEAVSAHYRRVALSRSMAAPLIRTYEPPLDEQNMTGQYVKVFSAFPNSKLSLDRDNPSYSPIIE